VQQPQREQDLSHDSGVEFGLHEMTTKDTRPNYLFFVATPSKLFSAGMHFSTKGLRCRKLLVARRGDFNDGCLEAFESARGSESVFKAAFMLSLAMQGDEMQIRTAGWRSLSRAADAYKRDTETPFGRPTDRHRLLTAKAPARKYYYV
jgi:hypothetical protein